MLPCAAGDLPLYLLQLRSSAAQHGPALTLVLGQGASIAQGPLLALQHYASVRALSYDFSVGVDDPCLHRILYVHNRWVLPICWIPVHEFVLSCWFVRKYLLRLIPHAVSLQV